MAAATVRVKGLRELQRDFRKMSKDLAKEVRDELKESAEPVRAEAARIFSDISPRSAAGYRVVARTRGVVVEQRLRRTTGKRPDFGRRQLRVALEPALERRRDDVIRGLERMLDRLAGSNGFH